MGGQPAGAIVPRAHRAGMDALGWATLLVLALSVLPLWGLSRDFHDGVIAEWAFATGRYAGVAEWLVPSNWWGHYALYRVVGALGDATGLPVWMWIKAWMTLVVAGLAYETYRFAGLYGFGRRWALAATMLTGSFPVWCVLYSSSVMHIGFCWLALLGHRWLFWCGDWRRWAGFVLVVVSFQVNANLVFQIALAVVAYGLLRERAALNRLLLVALSAVAFYLFFMLVHPVRGEYEGYNRLLLPHTLAHLLKIASTAALFASWAVLLVPSALVALLWRGGARKKPLGPAETAGPRQRFWIALLLTAAAVFPYAMVGKGPPLFLVGSPIGESVIWTIYATTGKGFHLTVDAFTTRQAALMAVPFSLLGVACLEWLAGRRALPKAAVATSVGVAVLSQACVLMTGHFLKWEQAHWDRSIINALKGLPPPPPGRVEIALSPTRPYLYHVFESNSLLWHAWNRTGWLGLVYYQGSPVWEQRARARLPHYADLMKQSPAMREYLLMPDEGLLRAGCVTRLALAPPTPDTAPWRRVTELLAAAVPPARVESGATRCGQSVFSDQP
jgi:hypothetical protein